MSQALVVSNYSFNKTAKTVTFSDYTSIKLEGIKLITNITTGTIIYQFNDSAKLGTISANILTLTFDTSAMSNTDKLMIIYDSPNEGYFDRLITLLQSAVELIRSPSYMAKYASGDKIAAQTDTNSSMGAVTSCATVTNLTNFNTIDSRQAIWSLWGTEYNTGIRNRIT